MLKSNQADNRMQSIRINKLEQQLHLIEGELHRLRGGMLRKNDVEKLYSFMERIKELNLALVKLRKYYDSMRQTLYRNNKTVLNERNSDSSCEVKQNTNTQKLPQNESKTEKNFVKLDRNDSDLKSKQANQTFDREDGGFGQETNQVDSEKNKTSDPFKTCKLLMEEIKSPGCILGNYLTRLKDFRTDAELRRQRLERKQQEKLQQQKTEKSLILASAEKATNTEEIAINRPNKVGKHSVLLEDTTIKNLDLTLSNRIDNNNGSSESLSVQSYEEPIIKENLPQTIKNLIKDADRRTIILSVVSENDLYHITVSHISECQPLACFLATNEAVENAKEHNLFQDFLTFFVVNAESSQLQKDRILGHFFEIVNSDF